MNAIAEPCSVSVAAFRERVAALGPIVRELAGRRPRPRGERLSGMHNPWGHAAVLANAWRFLDVCEDAALVDTIEALIGPDIVLWDSELHLEAPTWLRFVGAGREGRYWPAEPLAGAIALVRPSLPEAAAICIELASLSAADLHGLAPDEPLYVIRYMPATSRYVRDPRAARNHAAMQEQPLINYTTRPLWLVRGADRAGNDFVTGFSPAVPRWASHPMEHN
ncbi:MAG: hypothetical protein ACREXI_06325 [Caldimonas sp.]